MDEFTCEYDFEELQIAGFGDGLLLTGTAELSSDQEPGQFYISAIKVGDKWLTRSHCEGSLNGELFRAISIALYASDDVETFYAERYSDFAGPNTDRVYDATWERAVA